MIEEKKQMRGKSKRDGCKGRGKRKRGKGGREKEIDEGEGKD